MMTQTRIVAVSYLNTIPYIYGISRAGGTLRDGLLLCPPRLCAEALRNGDRDVEMMRGEYDMRRRLVVDSFNAMGLTCFEPLGAFYVFPCIKNTGLTSEEFCTRLIVDKHVAVVPGTAFGESGEGFVRVSYSYSIKHLKIALERIKEFLDELKKG